MPASTDNQAYKRIANHVYLLEKSLSEYSYNSKMKFIFVARSVSMSSTSKKFVDEITVIAHDEHKLQHNLPSLKHISILKYILNLKYSL